MRSIKSFGLKVIIASLLLLQAIADISAQNPQYLCELRNDVRIDANTYEFDVYMLQIEATTMEYAGMQFGINVNPGMRNGGTITVSYVTGSSGLLAAQIPVDTDLSFNSVTNCIEWSGTSHPGAGNGTIISNITPGTRVGRFRLSNTVSFGSVTPDLAWNFSPATGRVTTVSAYVFTTDTDITVQSSHTTLNLSNPLLNPLPPAQFDVTGGGMFCEGGAGVAVGLSGSESGVTYTLIRDETDLTPTVAGTGSPLSFGNQTTAGTYTVRGTNAGGNTVMIGNAIVTVSTNSTAPTSISITSNNTCFGTDKTLTVSGGTLGTGAIWEWFTASCGGTSAGTGPSITVNPAAGTSTTYYVRATGTCNTTVCASGTVTVPANVTTPTVPVPSATTICQGTPTISVTTSATNATSYNWTVSGTGNTVTGTGATATVNFNSAFSGVATISVSANGCNGPSAIASTNVTVRPTPTALISGTTSVCQNSPSPSVTFTNPQTFPVTVTYNIGGSGEANINVAASGTATLVIPTTTPGTFDYNLVSVTYQTAPTCSNTITGTATVTVNPTPAVTNQTGSITTGSTFTVTPTGVPVGTTYTWPVPVMSGGVTGGVAQSTGVSSISGTLYVPSGSGTAVYTVTPRAGTCTGPTFTVTITVTSTCEPVAFTAHPASSSICAGGSASFSAATTGTTPAYQWQYYNGAAWVSVANGVPTGAVYSNVTTTTLGVSGISLAGSYQYRCYATNCTVSTAQSNSATLTVNTIPAQPTLTVSQPTCSSATGTINISAPVGTGMTYSIDGTSYTNTNGIFTGVVPGSYNVTARSSAGCTSPIRIATVNDQPPTPVVGNQTASINTGQTFTVTPAGVPVGTTYTWPAPTYTGGVTGGVAQSTGVENISGTLTIPSGIGTAIYTVTPTAGTCVGNPFTVTVTVTSSCIPVTITSDPANASICAEGNASFSVTATGTTPAYQWQYYNGSAWVSVANGTPAGAVYTNAATATLNVAGITAAGIYQYRCNATNCSVSSDQSAAATLTVAALPAQPAITADGPLAICTGEDVVLTASEATAYLWSTGATTRSITVTAAGNYTVQVTNAAGCLSVASGTAAVTVNPLPSRPTITPSGTVNICAGSSRTLTSSTGTTYLWSTGETTSSLSVSTAGSYTVQVTNSYGCLSQPSLATTIVVNPLPATPTVTPSGSTAICAGSSVTLTSSVSTLYLWSNGATTQSIAVSTAGDYSVRVTDANGCQSLPSAVTTVTVNPLPQAPVVGTITQPTCTVSTGSVALSGLPATGNWTLIRSTGGTEIAGSGTTYTVAGLPAGTHTFTVTNLNGCTSAASAPVVISIPPAVPTAPVMGTVTQPTCAVTTGSVGISGLPLTGNWTLTRNPGAVEVTGSGTTFTASAIPQGTYTFTVTNAAGCISPASAPITITAPLPVPAAPVQTTDCTLGFNLAAISVTSPTGTGYSYQLDGGTFQTGTVFSNVANGTHRITVRNSSGCTTTGPEFSVNCGCVNPPLLTLSATSGSTCGIMAVTVTGNTFGGSATSVTITENGGGTVSQVSSTSSPFNFTYTPVAGDAGRVVVITVTTDNPLGSPCAAASSTYSLTVNANPVAPVPGTVTHPTCSLPTGSVILNSLPATGDWTVARNPGGQTTSGSGTSTTISGLAPGTYTFTVTNSNGCTSAASSNVVINVQPDTPSAPVTGEITQPTCALSTGSVALSGLPATGNWILTRIPGNINITGSGAARTVAAIPPGTYTFTVTNAAGCVSAASAEVVINTQPLTPNTPVIAAITHPTCDLATGSILLEGMPETGEWTLFRYPGGSSSNGTGSSTTISSLPAGIYNFSVRNADGCTSLVSANAVINVQPPTPTAPVVGTITHPTFAVPTGSVVLSGLPATGTWTLIRYPDGFTSQGTGTTRTVSGLEPGTYSFAVTNSVGCTSAITGDVVINARPGAPVVVINNPPTICENETTDLTAAAVTAGSDQNLTFSYWTDDAATLTYATPQTASAGTYYIMGTSTAGYYTIKPVVVTADELPVAYAGADQVLEYIFGTTLDADIPDVGDGLWELVAGTGNIFNPVDPATSVSGLSAGENVLSWTVTNGACDPVSDLVVITVNNLTVPTLITPNLDGRNDYFVLRGLSTLGRTGLTIFDRRGLKVYENSDYQNDWDGTDYNSNPLPDDTYFYVIRADNGVSKSGYIVVRR